MLIYKSIQAFNDTILMFVSRKIKPKL